MSDAEDLLFPDEGPDASWRAHRDPDAPLYYWELERGMRWHVQRHVTEEEGYLANLINHGRRLAATPEPYVSCPALIPEPCEPVEFDYYSDPVASLLAAAEAAGIDPEWLCRRAMHTLAAMRRDSRDSAGVREEEMGLQSPYPPVGGPGEITAHVFDSHGGSGREQHLGSLTIRDWGPDCPELRQGPYEIAARIWNFTLSEHASASCSTGLAIVGPYDEPPLRSQCWCRSDCDQCKAPKPHPEIWDALCEIRDAMTAENSIRLEQVDTETWARRDPKATPPNDPMEHT